MNVARAPGSKSQRFKPIAGVQVGGFFGGAVLAIRVGAALTSEQYTASALCVLVALDATVVAAAQKFRLGIEARTFYVN
jgi:crotonobetainyl-CoA:carnitine CoA-transferase CaiB-like acyl-CoA transferase